MPRHSRSNGISYSIVTHNERGIIASCLNSVLSQTLPPRDIIVTDNASSDGTPELIKANFDQVQVVENPENGGYAQAHNLGVAKTRSDFVAILNADVSLDPSWSTEMVRELTEFPDCAAAEGKLLLTNCQGRLNSRGSYLNFLGFGCASGLGEKDIPSRRSKQVSYPSGAAFVVRRDAFREVGGFDESYFLYHEDVDLGIRLQSSGWNVRYVPTAIAHHDLSTGLNPSKVELLERNRWITLAKNMPTQYFLHCGPLLFLSELGVLVYLAATGKFGAKVRAILNFLKQAPLVLERRSEQALCRTDNFPYSILTDEFPNLPGANDSLVRLARAIQSAYFRAFLSKLAPHGWNRNSGE